VSAPDPTPWLIPGSALLFPALLLKLGNFLGWHPIAIGTALLAKASAPPDPAHPPKPRGLLAARGQCWTF